MNKFPSRRLKNLFATTALLGLFLLVSCAEVVVHVSRGSGSSEDLPPGPSCNLPEKFLTITREDQETISWCWAASAQMVINYFRKAAEKPELKQCSIVDDVVNPPVTCCGVAGNSGLCNQGDLPENALDKKAFTYAAPIKDPSNRENLWGKITSQICENKPIILAEYFVGGGGHSSVIYGFGGNDLVGSRWVDLYDHVPSPDNVEQVNYDNEIYFVPGNDSFSRREVYYTFEIQPPPQ